MKKHITYLFSLLLTLAGAGTAHADDTEIYLNPDRIGGTPLVMFHMEYTSNLVSTICTGVTGTDFTTLDTECPQLESLAGYFAAHDVDDGKLSSYEMIRASLKRVLTPLKDLKVGLMLSHNEADTNKCGSTGCSDGGYILKGFTPMEELPSGFHTSNPTSTDWDLIKDKNPNKWSFFTALDSLPEPQGNLSHPNQNKEVYFEFYRYLEGFSVLNANNGDSDFGTDGTVKLGSEKDCTNNNKEVATVPCPVSVDPDTTLVGTGTLYLGPDKSIITNQGNYISPLTEDCQKVFVINILDGSGNANNGTDTEIAASYANEGMNLTVANDDPGFVQMLAWLHDVDLADGGSKTLDDGTVVPCDPTSVVNCNLDLSDKQNVISYFLAVQDQQVQDQAIAGGTRRAYNLSEDPSDIIKNLNSILSQIISTSTTFVSASIPVNVFNRSEVLNNMFVALFQTDKNGAPYWAGDIKKLKLDVRTLTTTDPVTGAQTSTDYLEVVDANNIPAIASDGRIDYGALTFWTRPTGYDVVAADSQNNEISGKDGRSVSRGGAGQKIPNFLSSTDTQGTVSFTNSTSGRKLYTEYNNALLPLEYSNMDKLWPSIFDPNVPELDSQWTNAAQYNLMNGTWSNDVGKYYLSSGCYTYFAGTAAVSTNYWYSGSCWVGDWMSNIFAYIRGKDAFDEDNDGNRDETRPWIFGDPLHSRPLPINYGARTGYTTTNPDIRLAGGSNDGFFRMIQNTDTSAGEVGKENWAFMPREALGIQKRLMENTPDSAHTHPYGVDGEPVAYMLDNNQDGTIETPDSDGKYDKVYIYFGMRRGGKAYYALDISNPDSPVFKWKITKTSGGDFDELGLTFSAPVVTSLNWGLGNKPVLIFAGGYDINKDTKGVLGTDDSEGNAIYIVDAETGALIWKAVHGANISASLTKFTHPDLVDSIPSTMTVIDTTGDGNADRAYVGDTGGTVWRVDFGGTDRTKWLLTKVLVAGRHYKNDLANDRRFFHAPDFVPAQDNSGPFDGVVIGSGNRAHPQDRLTEDFFYMIKDRDVYPLDTTTTDTWLLHDSSTASETLQDVTSDCLQMDPLNCSLNLTNGWKMQFDTSEKSLASPFTFSGDIYFNTYLPMDTTDTKACGPTEGTGRAYRVSLYNGNAVYNYDTVRGGYELSSDGTTTTPGELGVYDRYRTLDSGGVPSTSVYIKYKDIQCTMTPDLRCEESGKKAGWRTFWYKNEE